MNEIEILKKNVRDLQEQLRNAYVRIKQLNEELDKLKKPDKGLYNPDANHITRDFKQVDRARERRLKATGKWFKSDKKNKNLWVNHIFPVLLVVGFIFYIINL